MKEEKFYIIFVKIKLILLFVDIQDLYALKFCDSDSLMLINYMFITCHIEYLFILSI